MRRMRRSAVGSIGSGRKSQGGSARRDPSRHRNGVSTKCLSWFAADRCTCGAGIDTLTSNIWGNRLGWAMKAISYARHRFPPDVIRRAVWLYLRFTLSYRDVEDLLAERGLEVSNESIRRWVLKFGPEIARKLRSLRPRPHDQWHLDEMVVSIAGKRMYMWRAVDSEGEVLDALIQRGREGCCAENSQETASEAGLCSGRHRHRQTRILRRGAAGHWLFGSARARPARQQPGREFAPARATT